MLIPDFKVEKGGYMGKIKIGMDVATKFDKGFKSPRSRSG